MSSVILYKNSCCLLIDANNENVFFFITKINDVVTIYNDVFIDKKRTRKCPSKNPATKAATIQPRLNFTEKIQS